MADDRHCENCGLTMYAELGDGPALCHDCKAEAAQAAKLTDAADACDPGASAILAAVLFVVTAAATGLLWWLWAAAAKG